MKPAEDPHWEHYTSTVLELLADRSLVIDLALPIPSGLLDSRLGASGVGPTFAVVTACNPRGVVVSDAENGRLASRLEAKIVAAELPWVPADGVSPDGLHREVGMAIGFATSEDARRVAVEFGQSGFYWYDGAAMWLMGALVKVEAVRLPAGRRRSESANQ